MTKQYEALVVGAGIGGIRAALDLAEAGYSVALIDKRPNHGGLLAQLDYQFPSDHCGMCRMLPLMARDSSSQFCLRKGLFHENIDLMLATELQSLEGDPGNFQVRVAKKSTFVNPNRCISCGECAKVCPVRVKNEFNAGLTERTAVYLPVPHAIPNHFVVDLENCKRCWQCYKACPTGAIDFKFEERKDFRILIVDPDGSLADFLKEALKEQNFPIENVASGEEAIDRLAAGEAYKMLVLDLGVKDMDPERILMRIKEIRPDLPVIAAADEAQRAKAEELLGQGAMEIINKPLDAETLTPWLDKLYMRLVSDEILEFRVGAVILAGGFECYNPSEDEDVLGYGRYPGVVTSLEFERMASSSGPTGGKLVRLDDGRECRRIAWLQCVGSRNIQKNADFCSSICCMFSIKEALLAKKIVGERAKTSIFYMDMRTFGGKSFENYRQQAEELDGVKFKRARPHSITPANDGSLVVGYFGEDGKMHEEEYDLVVLAVGARPPKGMEQLARIAEIETNQYGFCKTREFSPARTSRLGVFAAGAFGEPKDIAESLIQSGAAAQGAARIIKIHEFLSGQEPEPEPEYPDVSRQQPKTLVALCSSCPLLGENADMEMIKEHLSALHSVCDFALVGSTCTEQGWKEISDLASKLKPNRILIGACMPYAYIPRLRELGRAIGLNPALMDVVDVYTPAFPNEERNKEFVTKDMLARMGEALARLEGVDPLPPPIRMDVARRALVVGGGLAGMTAAKAIADQGYDVVLVEETEALGGNAMRLHYTLEGNDPAKHMQELIENVESNPRIKVLKDSRVVFSDGYAGRFRSAITGEHGAYTLEHGVTILATGGNPSRIYEYGFKVNPRVISQLRLEERLATGELDVSELGSVVMIQCWRSRDDDRDYCSRICCGEALKNILYLKSKKPDLPIYVFYRDIMSYGFREEYYTKAREAGAIFIRYDPDNRPEVEYKNDKPVVIGLDPVIGRKLRFEPDLVVLSTGVEPGETESLQEVFGIDVDRNGFFKEAESKWRPVDFLKQGIFMCGLARSPGNMSETIASAQAAAARAIRVLRMKTIPKERIVATVRQSLCSLCLRCIEVCPYEARRVDLENERVIVDEILCQGCGSCAAVCPNSATVLSGYHDGSMMAVIDAALVESV